MHFILLCRLMAVDPRPQREKVGYDKLANTSCGGCSLRHAPRAMSDVIAVCLSVCLCACLPASEAEFYDAAITSNQFTYRPRRYDSSAWNTRTAAIPSRFGRSADACSTWRTIRNFARVSGSAIFPVSKKICGSMADTKSGCSCYLKNTFSLS